MIDEARTLELFGYTSDGLAPQSSKPIVAVCEECGKCRVMRKQHYRVICRSCVQRSKSPDSESTRRKKSESAKTRPVRRPVSDATKQKMRESNKGRVVETRRRMSAAKQGIEYDDWESFAKDQPYCPNFNEACKESNREKYGRRCFITGKPEADNTTTTCKHYKLSVHHVDMNKDQGCAGHVWKLVPLGLGRHTVSHGKVWTARIEYLLEHVWYQDGVWAPDALC